MAIEISKDKRAEVIASIQKYFEKNMEDKIGNITASALLDFMIDELGPIVYNKAVADVQSNLQARVMEVDMEVYEDEFQYWGKFEPKKKG